MIISLSFLIITLSLLFTHLVLEFAIPLLLKNGMTVGKKIFGIGVMHENYVRIKPVSLFVRAILGKYTIETMVPVLMVLMIYFGAIGMMGIIIIGLVLIFNVALIITTKTNSAIHDAISQTVTVDMATQLIFDTPEALLEYKQRVHEEEANKASYF